MSRWTERLAAPFQPGFAKLWVALDPDELLLTPPVAATLSKRNFEVIPRGGNSIAFRLAYETSVRDRPAEAGPVLIHLASADRNQLPWDVLQRARAVTCTIAGLFASLHPGSVRMLGAEKLDNLWDAVQAVPVSDPIGETATFDFLLTQLYGFDVPRLQEAAYVWAACFDLFFSGDQLPPALARHVAQRAMLPKDVSREHLVGLLSSRTVFLDRVQRDWDTFSDAAVLGIEADPSVLPFGKPRIRTSLDSMVLDGAIRPRRVGGIPDGVPRWMRIGLVLDENQAAELFGRRVEHLLADIPDPGAEPREWMVFAERQASVLADLCLMPQAAALALQQQVDAARLAADYAFSKWLEHGYGHLSSNAVANTPYLVHQIAPHMLHLRGKGSVRQALIVIDGLALDQWLPLERSLRMRRQDLAVETRTCFAWLPTLTEVSRQSIFAGCLPRQFRNALPATPNEEVSWRRFWTGEGMDSRCVAFHKNIGLPGSTDDVLAESAIKGERIVGLVVNTVDRLVHGTVLGKRQLAASIRMWTENGEWDKLVDGLLRQGYDLFVTADHGNVDAVGIGRPSEGSLPTGKGERVRVYNHEGLRAKAAASMPDSRMLRIGGLPSEYLPLFAPFGGAFVPRGQNLVAHGGTSIEEVMVPFARIRSKQEQ